ncbi:hypothetical protein DFJ74DRAFT_663776 [Hyaloraphidium curvatum]|nr:hypothetical protein DFJ74DRAFT_663776 [Hyaloraphidium curvatum]
MASSASGSTDPALKTSPSKANAAAAEPPAPLGADGPKMMPLHHKHPLAKVQQKKGDGTFMSPTDNMMSPTTQKLMTKKKNFLQNVKPKSLSSSFTGSEPQ